MTTEDVPAKGRFFIHTALGLSDADDDELAKELLDCYESEDIMSDVLSAAAKGRVAADVMMGYKVALLFAANNEAKL